jgi:benzoate membrane transport protein
MSLDRNLQELGQTSDSIQSDLDRAPLARVISTAVVTVIVGITSSVALVFTAAEKAGASPRQIGSWIGALCIGKGICSIVLSLKYKTPFLLAWSTPGAALLAASSARVDLRDYVGAFILCGVLLLLTGVTGVFDRVIDRIPISVGSALLAGVLTRFALEAFGAASVVKTRWLILSMFGAFVLARRLFPTFAAVAVLAVGVVVAVAQNSINTTGLSLGLVDPSFVRPSLSISVLIGVGIPLYVVTMAAQNVPGTAALRSHGYENRVSPALTASGIATVLLAPFGLYAINLAAITASMVMSEDIHPDRTKRYPAAVAAGGVYVFVGVVGGSVAGLIGVLPKALVIAVAAFALIPTIANGLTGAVTNPDEREAAVVVFLVTVSGLTMGQIGAPFWALLAGVAVLLLRRLPPLQR